MQNAFSSTLFLTLLLTIGLVFFLRGASKDRTTVVDVHSSLPALEVLEGLTNWLEERGWKNNGGDIEKRMLSFTGSVASSNFLIVFVSTLGGLGSGCLGLVLSQLYPPLGWWPLSIGVIGASLAGVIYKKKSARVELLELKLLNSEELKDTVIRIRAHRDELIAIELELGEILALRSDGSLLSSPI